MTEEEKKQTVRTTNIQRFCLHDRLCVSDDGYLLKRDTGVEENIDVLYMGFTEAEAVKLFANTYLILKVSFFNELDT